MKKIIKYHPLEWFEQHAFKDHDGDYWKHKDDRNHYDKFHNSPIYENAPASIYYVEGPIELFGIFDEYQWAIEKVYNKEENPELFI